MRYPPLLFTPAQRAIVDEVIREKCAFRGWTLHVARVLSEHIHVVVGAPVVPEIALGDFKYAATRRLRQEAPELGDRAIWARHGSTRYLFDEQDVRRAVSYVLDDHHGAEDARDRTKSTSPVDSR